MAALQKIVDQANPNLTTSLTQILPKLLVGDSGIIKKATQVFKKLSHHEKFLPSLTKIILSNCSQISEPTKQLAAVLLRRKVVNSWNKLKVEMKSLIMSASLEFLDMEGVSLVLYRNFCEIVAGILKMELKSGRSWDGLMDSLEKCLRLGVF